MGLSIRKTHCLTNELVDLSYEHKTVLSIPPSLPQIRATDGGLIAANIVTDMVPCTRQFAEPYQGIE